MKALATIKRNTAHRVRFRVSACTCLLVFECVTAARAELRYFDFETAMSSTKQTEENTRLARASNIKYMGWPPPHHDCQPRLAGGPVQNADAHCNPHVIHLQKGRHIGHE